MYVYIMGPGVGGAAAQGVPEDLGWVYRYGTYLHTYIRRNMHTYIHTYIHTYGQFSKFQICFCGLDPGNLKFETVRTRKQHVRV